MDGIKLADFRKKLKLSQLQMAHLLGTKIAVVAGVEKGLITAGSAMDAYVDAATMPEAALKERMAKVNTSPIKRKKRNRRKEQIKGPVSAEVLAVAKVRKAAGVSQMQFGQLVGMHASDVCNIENGIIAAGNNRTQYITEGSKFTVESLAQAAGTDPRLVSIGLSLPTIHRLRSAGITTLEKLKEIPEKDLHKLPNIGWTTSYEIKTALKDKPQSIGGFFVPAAPRTVPAEMTKQEEKPKMEKPKMEKTPLFPDLVAARTTAAPQPAPAAPPPGVLMPAPKFVPNGSPIAQELVTDGKTMHLFTLVPGGVFISFVGEMDVRRRG